MQLPSLVAHVFPALPSKSISLHLVYDHSTVLSDLLKQQQQATGRQPRPAPFLGWQYLSPQERDEAARLVASRPQSRKAPPPQTQPPLALGASALTTGSVGKAKTKADGLGQAEASHGQRTAAAVLPAQAAKRQRVEPSTEPHPKLIAAADPAAAEPHPKPLPAPTAGQRPSSGPGGAADNVRAKDVPPGFSSAPPAKTAAAAAAATTASKLIKVAKVPSSQGAEVAAEAMPEAGRGQKKQKLLLPQDQPATEAALPLPAEPETGAQLEAETQDLAPKSGKQLPPPGTATATKSGADAAAKSGCPDTAVRPDAAAAKSGRPDAEGRPEVASAESGRPDSAVRSAAAAVGSAKPPTLSALGSPSKALASRPGDSAAPAPAVSGEGTAGPVAREPTAMAVEGRSGAAEDPSRAAGPRMAVEGRSRAVEDPARAAGPCMAVEGRSRAVEDPSRAAGPSSHPGDPSSMGPKERECTVVRGL